jgi:hypothetical protein
MNCPLRGRMRTDRCRVLWRRPVGRGWPALLTLHKYAAGYGMRYSHGRE